MTAAPPAPASDAPARSAAATPPVVAPVPHSRFENIVGIATACLLLASGLSLIQAAGSATGGTAGLGLLLAYATGWPFGAVFVLVNAPFFALAVWRRGWAFTLRTVVAVAVVAGLVSVNHVLFSDFTVDPLYGSLLGNVIAGVGQLALFRHNTSIGGFGILALILQDRFGWRVGYVQLALDAAVLLASFAVLSPLLVLVSLAGAVVLNITVALNHRPGRYIGY